MRQALCIDMDTRVFFVDEDDHKGVAYAKSICNKCCIREDCLDTALANYEDGIWGGMTFTERGAFRLTSYLRAAKARSLQESTLREQSHPVHASLFVPLYIYVPTDHMQQASETETVEQISFHVSWPEW